MQHLYQHTAALLHVLEAKGRRMGTDEYLQVQELLRTLPPDTDPDTLLLVLAPLLARNPAEQEELYELFQTVKNEIAAIQAPLPVPPPHPGARRWKWRIAIPALLLTALCAGLVWYYLTSPQQPVALLAFPARFGQTRTECPDNLPEIQQFGTIRATERLYPPTANTAFGVFFIDSAACITYTALDSVGSDSIVVRLYGAGDKTILLLYKPYLEPPPALPDSVTPEKDDDAGITFEPKADYPYEHDLLQFAVVDPPDWLQFFKNWWPILRWGAFILFTLLLVAVWRYRAFKRRQLVAEQQSKDKPLYAWNVRIDGADELVSAEALRAAAQVLRRRAKGDTDDLDVPRSVQATAAAGGMPAFRFRRHTLPPEYLMLIDRQQGENHRARLYDLLYRGLRENEVEINRFFYDAEPRVLFNEEHPRGITLGELQQRHAQSRLILVGSGGQLLSPLDGRPASWTSQLSAWNHRLLLTPKAAAAWGRDERRLAELFTLLPAGIESLRFWLEEVEQGEDARFDDWHNRIPAAARPPLTLPENPALLPIYLEGQLGTDMLRWVAACAVYPALHWDLTMWLNPTPIPSPKGDGGRDANRDVVPSTSPLPFRGGDGGGVSWPAAEALTRIPWFVSGRMPKEARSALLDWFEKTDPEGLSATRAKIAALLSQNPPPKDSAAWDQYRMHIALNQWLSTTDAAQKKQLEQEIALLLESGAEADFTVVKYLDAKRSPLEFPVPEAWKKFVYPGGYRALGWLRDWKDLRWLVPVWLAAAMLCLWPWKMPGDACTENRVTWTPREGQAVEICLETPEAKLLYAEDQLLRLLENGDDTILNSQKFIDFTGRQEKRLKYIIIQSGQKPLYIFLADRSKDTAAIVSLATDLEKVFSSRGYGETNILYRSSDNDTSAADFDDTPFLRTMEHRLSMETRFGISPIDSFYIRLKEAHANIATAVFNLGVKHYRTYDAQAKTDAKETPAIKNSPAHLGRLAQLRDSACVCFTMAARLDSLDFENRRAAAWCLGETAKPPAALHGRVLNASTGQPIAGALVRAGNPQVIPLMNLQMPNALAAGGLAAKTDAQGNYTLVDIPAAAQLQFYVSAPGYLPANARAPLRDPLPDIRLTPEGAPAGQRITIRGLVEDAKTRQPIAGVIAGSDFGEIATDTRGRFQLEFAVTGTYNGKVLFTFEKEGYEPYRQYVVPAGNTADAMFYMEKTSTKATLIDSPPLMEVDTFEKKPSSAGITLEKSSKIPPYVVGDIVEDFSLQNVDGRIVSLSGYPKAKGFIIVFISNHCPYSQLYEQRIIDLHNKFNPLGFPVIAINSNDPEIIPEDSFEKMKLRAKERKFPFAYLLDSDPPVFRKFGATRTPHAFVLEMDKDLIVRYSGSIDDNPESPSATNRKYVESAVNALLRGEQPNPDYTRPIGCIIRRKK